MSFIDNCWYVGCASSQLTFESPVGTQIGDRRIVLFRNDEGRVSALLDRCCHRGFPLSHGSITAGRVRCGYHGWEFDSVGRCVKIPSQITGQPIPRSFRVESFPCREQDAYVWVWIGQDKSADLPRVSELASGAWLQGAVTVQCNYLRALEITYDMCHVPFVHPTHPRSVRAREQGLVETVYELQENAAGCVVVTPPSDPQQPTDPDFMIEFRLPATVRFQIRTESGLSYMFFHVTPLTETSCRMNWLVSNGEAPGGSPRIDWHGEGGSISAEDRAVLELVQPAYDREGESFERSVKADWPTLALRRLVKAAERGERSAEGSETVRRLLSIVTVPRSISRRSSLDSRERPRTEHQQDRSDAQQSG